MSYVRLRSWHTIAGSCDAVYDDAVPLTRCGLHAQPDSPTADTLPLNERSCETCLRLSAHDGEVPETPEVSTDEPLGPPDAGNDTVPG